MDRRAGRRSAGGRPIKWRELRVDDELLRWFDAEGLLRFAAYGDPDGTVVEVTRGPLVALGPHDADYRLAPHPQRMAYRVRLLRERTLEDYPGFTLTCFRHALPAGRGPRRTLVRGHPE